MRRVRNAGVAWLGFVAALGAATGATLVAGSAAAQERSDGGLSLMEAVARAYETYPSVGVARAGEEVASASLGQARAAWWPALRMQASARTFEEPMPVAPFHGFAAGQIQDIEFEETLFQGDLSLTWTLYDGGARTGRIRAARAAAAAAQAARSETEMELIARVTRSYLEVLSAGGVLEAHDRQLDALRAERERADQFLGEGRAAPVELLRVEAALAEAEAQRIATAARLDIAERDLARLLDVSPDSTRVGQLRPLALPDVELEPRGVLVERARAANPELERAWLEVRQAEAERRAAKAAWIPSFEVSGALMAFSSDAGNTTTEWNVGVGLSYPLFTGGARANAVGRASAAARVARQRSRLVELRVEEATERALSGAVEARALVEATSRALRHRSEVARIELLSLEAGAGTQTDYLRAEADLLRARSLLVEARHVEIAARVELARVTGALTPPWLEENLEASP